ncbi:MULTISPECIES: prolyl hydroxylase family protein [unclassified Sphingomonas]|uniref:prolyl hydroxylase family protein n=1 Tax=unclassified Sphingomonas TaxID=196159 RepID=UPI0009E71625|nr:MULTISPECIES: 2OG-Fe(II) oxygenase [unclassified Sphingomonas]MBD8549902.1 2OG-Fe(II) oxygenase [Sphingomonas sp. CFBP 8764]
MVAVPSAASPLSAADRRDGPVEALARAESAAHVREQILCYPGAVRIPASGIELYVVRDFLPLDVCATLIALIDADRVPSPVVADDPRPAYRTSETCYLYAGPDAVTAVETRLDALTGLEPRYGEALQGQRYAVGQEFKPHHDFFDTGQLYWQDQVAVGGQRTWSAMTFLNEPEAGGRTNFPTADVIIAPKAGNLVIWNNMDDYGAPNPGSVHQGMPVEQGVKYVLTKWYRERPWGQ